MRRISQGGRDPAAVTIDVNESGPLDTIATLPADRESGIGFFYVDRLRVTIMGEPRGELLGWVEQPSIAGLGCEQDKLTDADDAPVASGCSTLKVADLIGEMETLTVDQALARSTLDRCAARTGSHGG